MEILQSIILGAVQGITEVLPISSSGHLVLFPWLFNFKDPGLSFDVALHLGTLVAIFAFFFDEVIAILRGGVNLIFRKDPSDIYQKLFLFLVFATIPGVLAGYFLNGYAEDLFRSPLLISFNLVFFGIVLFLADRFGTANTKGLENIDIKRSFLVGFAQALAIIPGVSRSGITMSAGLFRGLSRESAAEFSFLLSMPIIFGASIFELKDLSSGFILSPIFVSGFLSALIFSFLSVKFLMNYIKNYGFKAFVYYRFILAAVILLVYLIK